MVIFWPLNSFEHVLNQTEVHKWLVAAVWDAEGRSAVYTNRWGKDLQRSISEGLWLKLYKCMSQLSVNIDIRENILKTMYRGFVFFYFMPDKVTKISLGASEKRWLCNKRNGTVLHTWWQCPQAFRFLTKIFKEINKILHCKIACEPKVALLSILPEDILQKTKYVLKNLLVAARQHKLGNSQICWLLMNGLVKYGILHWWTKLLFIRNCKKGKK